METTVVIVQHGEKEPGAGDPGLSERGRRQADFAAEALAALRPVLVVSSPWRRARETAAALARRFDLPVVEDQRLGERMNLSVGQDVAAFVRDWQRTIRDRRWSPGAPARSSRETAAEMFEALQSRAVEGRAVAFASHGGATVDLLRDLVGDDELDGRAPGVLDAGMPGGGLTTLVRRGSTWTPVSIAAIDHIPLEERTGHVPG